MIRRAARWEGQTLEQLKERWDRPHVHLYAQIGSTNQRAVELADEGAPAGTIVLADEQTGGRGLISRNWFSPRGDGLYISIVFRPPELANPQLIPLLAGLGTVRATLQLVDTAPVGIKWPNDLIIDNRKAGGVLSETSGPADRANYVVLGVGVNVHQQQDDFPVPLRDVAISLDMAAGHEVSRLELADRIVREVEERCANPPESLNRELLRELDNFDWLRDRRCAVRTSRDADPTKGVAVGIAPDGALLFRPDKGALARVTSGRVIAEDLRLPDY